MSERHDSQGDPCVLCGAKADRAIHNQPAPRGYVYRGCADCGERHISGLDAFLCDYRLGGEARVRDVLRRTGVPTAVADRTVADVLAVSPQETE